MKEVWTMKQVEKNTKKPASEQALTCGALTAQQTKSQTLNTSNWTRYADSRLKQFCTR